MNASKTNFCAVGTETAVAIATLCQPVGKLDSYATCRGRIIFQIYEPATWPIVSCPSPPLLGWKKVGQSVDFTACNGANL